MTEIKAAAQQLNDQLIQWRRDFHENPEPSGAEKETSRKIKELLEGMGYEVKDHVGGYGLVAVLKGKKPGKTVALRADMDALQIQELNQTDYKSRHDGVMHACGHDNHIAMLLGAAKLLMENKDEISGSIKLIFQPAEEMSPVGGSRKMIEEGVLEDVDAIFGLHVWPDLPHGTVGIKPGVLMAASDHFTVKIKGKSSHAAQPNDGNDAIVMGVQYVQSVQNIISREISPLDSAVITIGKFEAGTRYNILAESCVLEGTCRTLSEEVRTQIEKQLKLNLDGICLMNGASGEFDYEKGYMAVVNDEEMTGKVRKTVTNLFGEKAVADIHIPSMCAEDFSFYLKEKPGAFVWLGTGKEGEKCPPLHNSRFDVNEDILWRGAALLAQTAIDVAGE